MKKAIISELSNENTNYGNRLQSYALNRFISSKEHNSTVYSLMFEFGMKKIVLLEKLKFETKKIIKRIRLVFKPYEFVSKLKLALDNNKNELFEKRLLNCQNFTKKINTLQINDFGQMKNMDFDIVIVGSDIVWLQREYYVDKLRFLAFKLKRPFKKISYAASFGQNWIPERNKKYIKKYLDDFTAISVREKSSIELLKGIGVENVVHVCDPTLLLTVEEWSSVAEPIEEVSEKYIFAYLLGKDLEQRASITELAKKHNLKIATIPHADNIYSAVDDEFGDYKLMDAGPENWVWLIKNAEYIITDSFHGAVFSTIFAKKFIVAKRHYLQDINIRMTDFLDTIGEQDKFVDITTVNSLDDFVWDYEKIHKTTDEFIVKSKEYLKNALTE